MKLIPSDCTNPSKYPLKYLKAINPKPNTAINTTKLSGMIFSLKSTMEIKSNIHRQSTHNRAGIPNPICSGTKSAISAAIVSPNGYLHEIGFLQVRHLPIRNTKLKMGMRSIHSSLVLHCGHIDRPTKASLKPFLTEYLNPRTLMKLPLAAPKTKSN